MTVVQDRRVKIDFLMALAVLMQQHNVTMKLKCSENILDMDVDLINTRFGPPVYSTINIVRHGGTETQIDSDDIIALLNKEKADV